MVPVIIALLVTGFVLILASFIFRDSFSDEKKGNIMTEAEIERLVERRFSEVKYQLDDEAEKSADIIKDQTERELEKLSNEKIMAVNEYSDQVMDQINRNHNEVMFLYSMLSDKQKELDAAVEQLNRAKQQAANEERLAQRGKQKKNSEEVSEQTMSNSREPVQEPVQLRLFADEEMVSYTDEYQKKDNEDSGSKEKTVIQEEPLSDNEKYANKQRILQMYKDGQSELEIARQLQLGIGEVRLVIGLNRNREA